MLRNILFFVANLFFAQALSVRMIVLILAADGVVLVLKLMKIL